MHLGKREWQVLSAWFITIVLLAGGFALYSYLYVERREQYFTEKKLRELRLLGDRLKLQVENIANNVLPNAVKGGTKSEIQDCVAKTGDPSLHIYESNGSARLASLAETCLFLAVSKKTQLVPYFTLEKVIEYGNPAETLNKSAAANEAPSRVAVSKAGDVPAFLFTYQASQIGTNVPKWRGRIDVANLLGQSSLDPFDQLVVTDIKGEVQFQFGATRVASTNVASLVNRALRVDKPEKSGEGSEPPPASGWTSFKDSAGVVTVKLAGEDYLLFLQPKKIALLGNETADQLSTGNNLNWRVIGLISSDRFRRDSSTFSYTTIVVFLFAVLLLFFAEPFIKIRSLGGLDRLQKRDVILLFVSAALTTALATVFASDVYAYGKLEQQVDSQLETLGKKIQSNFADEVSDLLGLLQNLSEKEIPPLAFKDLPNLLASPPPSESGKSGEGKPDEETCKDTTDLAEKSKDPKPRADPKDVKERFLHGAFFERIVWIDPCGMQKRKWTIYNTITPLIPVGERPYFQSVANGRLWKKELKDGVVCFWMGALDSWNTGERQTTLAVRGPANDKQETPLDGSCEAHDDQTSHWVLSSDVFLPSLRNVVLPPGYGFVVIDGEGKVLFHSDPTHLREDFFEESDQEPALRASVFGRATEFFNLNYLGTGHRVHSRPFDAPPWTLLVFYDKHLLRTSNVEILATTLVLFVFLLALQLPALAILWFRDTHWLWFDETRRTAYPPHLTGILGLVLLFLIAIFAFTPVSVAYAAFLIPPVVLPLTYFNFRSKRSAETSEPGILDWVLSVGPPLVVVATLFYGCWLERRYLEPLFLTVATALFARLIFVQKIRTWLNQVTWFPSTRTCYLLTSGGLLVLLGLLPALALFRIAYENEMVLLLRHGQYRLEASLAARKIQLQEQAIKIQGIGGKSFFAARMDGKWSRDVYQDFFFSCTSFPASPENSPPFHSPLGYALKRIRLHMLFDRTAIESQGLLSDVRENNSATWLGGHASCLSWVSSHNGPPSEGSPETSEREQQIYPSAVQVPTWWKTDSGKWFLVLVLLAAGLLRLVFFITQFIAKRVFIVDLKVPSDVAKAPDDADFASVWQDSSLEEKVALYDFATDGFLNSKNHGIESLLKRGLITVSPIRLSSDSFKEAILKEGAKDEDLAPGKIGELSVWQKMKWPLLVALLAIAGFLFFSQRKVFEGGVGFLGALAAAATAFFNILDQIRGGRR